MIFSIAKNVFGPAEHPKSAIRNVQIFEESEQGLLKSSVSLMPSFINSFTITSTPLCIWQQVN
jgi:hypothetical protein